MVYFLPQIPIMPVLGKKQQLSLLSEEIGFWRGFKDVCNIEYLTLMMNNGRNTRV